MSALINPTSRWLINRVGGAIAALGVRRRLEPDALRAQAAQRAGLSDFGEAPYPEALKIAAASLNDDAELSPFGRLVAGEVLTGILVRRLRLIALRKTVPERLATPPKRPIIILGLPRSGTTLMHRLLGGVDGLRPLHTWEMMTALSPKPADARRAEAEANLGIVHRLAPELEVKHPMRLDAPEEEVTFFDASLWTPSLWRFGRVYRYLDWQLSADPDAAYRVFRELVGLRQAAHPNERLLFKLPNHTGFVAALLKHIPDAVLVRSHRDPVPIVASYCSLASSVMSMNTETSDRERLGAASLELWRQHHLRFEAARDQIPSDQLFELDFERLRREPAACALEVLRFAGHPVDEGGAARLEAHASAPRPHGTHRYALEDWGLTEAQVRAAIPSP